MRISRLLLLISFCLPWVPIVAAEEDFEMAVYEDHEGRLIYQYRNATASSSKGAHQKAVWIPATGGAAELVSERPISHRGVERPEDVFRKGDEMAMIVGSSFGVITYERYRREDGAWKLVAENPLGSPLPDHRGGKFVSLTEYQQLRKEGPPRKFEFTDLPLFPKVESTRRLTLLDGKPYHPPGMSGEGVIWDLPLDEILADHQARTARDPTPRSKTDTPDDPKPEPKRAPQTPSRDPQAGRSPASSDLGKTTLLVGGAVLVVVIGAALLLGKRA